MEDARTEARSILLFARAIRIASFELAMLLYAVPSSLWVRGETVMTL
jgi:hypothetical protein